MSILYTPSFAKLVHQLKRLPGVGAKSAERLAFHLLTVSPDEARALAGAIVELRDKTMFCGSCGSLSETAQCSICADPRRDDGLLCVVEAARDIVALERTHAFSGRYHVLGGALSPLDGIGPEKLRIAPLLERLRAGTVREVVLALDPDVEGDTTGVFLAQLLRPLGVKVTKIAQGLPIGGDLEYADQVTLARALEGRRSV